MCLGFEITEKECLLSKSLHFDFPFLVFSLPGGFTIVDFSRQGYFSYKVLGRKYTNVVFWLLSRLLSPFLR